MSVFCLRFLGGAKHVSRVTSLVQVNIFSRQISSKQVQCSNLPTENDQSTPNYLAVHKTFDVSLKSSLTKDMIVISDFLSADEEYSILKEIEPYLKRLRYEFDHWDDVRFCSKCFLFMDLNDLLF